MQQYVLGIDIGTGSTKAVAVGINGEVVGSAQHYYPIKNSEPGYAEQDPQLIFEAFKSCILDIVSKYGQPLAISLSSAMHSLLCVDTNGNPLADMLIWADARSQDVADRIRKSKEGEDIYRVSGTPIHAMTPLCKLIWLRDNQPALFQEAFKWLSIKEYIWYQLFGSYQVDHSIASATGLFDINHLTWNATACQLAGISTDKLSEPVSTTYYKQDLRSDLAALLGLNSSIPFLIGASDGCCANLGSFVSSGDAGALTIGTSGAVRITSNQPIINTGAMIFNYVLTNNTFVCGGAVNNGGGAVQWLIKSLLQCERPGHKDYDRFFNLAAAAPAGSEGVIFLPYINGERAPLWDTRASGTFFNLRQQHRQSHLARAGVEGICFALNDVLQTLEQSSAVTITRLHVSGGFIKSPLWLQILADITGKQLIVLQDNDASALGAIYLAIDALKLPQTFKIPPAGEQTLIEPNIEVNKVYQQNFKVFKKLYVQLKELMQELN